MKKEKMRTVLLPILGYLVVVVVVFGGALFPASDELLFGDDIHRHYYFHRQFFNTWFARGIIPWWNPYVFSGMPFVANPVVNLWYLPTWIFTFVPLTYAYPWHVALHLVLGMSGMYWMVKVLMPPSSSTAKPYTMEGGAWIGPWAAGLVYGLSGYLVARIWAGHVDLIAAASFMPWVFGMFWRAFQTNSKFEIRNSKLVVHAGLVLGVQLLAGYQTMAIFTMEAVLVAAVVIAVGKRTLRPLVIVLLGSVIGGGIAAIQLVPLQQELGHSIRTFSLPYDWSSFGAQSFEHLRMLIYPFAFGDQTNFTGPPPNFAEHAGFIGKTSVILMLIAVGMGMRAKKTRAIVIVLISVLIIALWITLAQNAPIDLLNIIWSVNPIYQGLRFPSRHLILYAFAGAGLVGIGLSYIRHRVVQLVIIGLLLVEMIPFARHFIETQPIPEVRHKQALIDTVVTEDELARVFPNYGVWIPQRDVLDFAGVMSYGVFSATGYDVSIMRNYYEFVDAANGNTEPSIRKFDVQVPYFYTDSRYLDFLNVKHIMSAAGYDPYGGVTTSDYILLEEDLDRSYLLYENTNVLPRFYVVPELVVVSERDMMASAIRDQTIDLSQSAITDTDVDTTTITCNARHETVDVISYTPNRIELKVNTPCTGVLVSSEVFYPGWEARIDGKRVDLFEGNMAFRTIIVPEGEHTVEYVYRPTIYVIGGLITIITLMGSVIVMRITKH